MLRIVKSISVPSHTSKYHKTTVLFDKLPKMSSRTVLLDVNAQLYESGGFFGKWRDCRIILYSDSRLDWFFDSTKLAGSLILKDLSNHVSFDGVTAEAGRNKPFVPKLIRANLLFSVATDASAKYFHWFLFEDKNEYNQFCDTLSDLLGKTRVVKKSALSARSPSVDPSKRKPRSRSAAPNRRLRFIRGGVNSDCRDSDTSDTNSVKMLYSCGAATPTPIRRNKHHPIPVYTEEQIAVATAKHGSSIEAFLNRI
uniref:PH domain-containing protein n=1 Tax=Panagrellus redivivus TaxID=6233 RepID=A0A7E4VEZ9_PANRE